MFQRLGSELAIRLIPFLGFVALVSNPLWAGQHGAAAAKLNLSAQPVEVVIPEVYYSPEMRLDVKLANPSDEEIRGLLKGPKFWACRPDGTVNLYGEVSEHLRRGPDSSKLKKRFSDGYDLQASKLLSAAITSGNPIEMASVALQYRFTPAGERAVKLAILMLADRGQDLSAAYFFKGWLSDRETNVCPDKALHPFLFKGLTLYKTAGLFENAKSLARKLEACDSFTAGTVTAKNLRRHLSSAVPFDPSKNFENSWYEKKGMVEASASKQAAILKMAVTYGANGKEIDNLFGNSDGMSPCDHLDIETTYREMISLALGKEANPRSLTRELQSAAKRLSRFYPVMVSRLMREFKQPLLEAVLDPTAAGRWTAFALLEETPEELMPGLISALSGEGARVLAALELLPLLGERAVSAAPALIKMLDHPDPAVRGVALRNLARVGGDGTRVIVERLLGNDAQKRAFTLRTLERVADLSGGVVEALIHDALTTKSVPLNELAELLSRQRVEALAPFTSELITIFETYREVTYPLATIFGHLGPRAANAVPALIRRLGDEGTSPFNRIVIILALRDIGPKAESAIPVLFPYLEEDQYSDYARHALSEIGEKAIPGLEAILLQELPADLEMLTKKTWVKKQSVRALSDMGVPGVPALSRALSNPEPAVAKRALEFLGLMGGQAENAAPAIYALLEKEGPLGAIAIGETLGKIGVPARPIIAKAVKSPSASKRQAGMAALKYFPFDGEFALPHLKNALSDSSAEVRAAALSSLLEFGDTANALLPIVIDAAKDPSAVVRKRAAVVLGGMFSPLAVKALDEALTDPDAETRLQALSSLNRHGDMAKTATDSLLKLLDSPVLNERRMAIDLLSQFKTPAILDRFRARLKVEKDEYAKKRLFEEAGT